MKPSLTVCVVASESELRCLRRRVDAGRIEVRGSMPFFFGTMHGRDICLARSGVGRKNAAAAARAICFDLQPGFVVVAGAAGALESGLEAGALVVVDRILQENGGAIDCAGDVSRQALAALRASGLQAQSGWCCQARTFMHRAADKQALHGRTGAHVVDMESAAFAVEFIRAGVPFVDIRVVSDSVRRDTADMERLARLRFRRGRSAAVLHLLRHPRELVRACVFYRGMAVAAGRIADAAGILLAAAEPVNSIST